MKPDYQADLNQAKLDLDDLLRQREKIEIRIARQKRRVAALAEICSADEASDSEVDLDLGGLTEACITVLRGSPKEWISTSEIQGALRELGFPIHRYKAPNASIATTINRMVEDGFVSDKRGSTGVIEYKWVGRINVILQHAAANQILMREQISHEKQIVRDKLRALKDKHNKK